MPLSKLDYENTLNEVKENIRKLEGCPGPHEFEITEKSASISRRYRCKTCGGTVDAIARAWYERGLQHGARIAYKAPRSPNLSV